MLDSMSLTLKTAACSLRVLLDPGRFFRPPARKVHVVPLNYVQPIF